MKRLLVRLSVLAVVAALATFAVAQVQHGFGRRKAAKPSSPNVASAQRATAPQPVPVAAAEDVGSPIVPNPFNNRQVAAVDRAAQAHGSDQADTYQAGEEDIPHADEVMSNGEPGGGASVEPRRFVAQDAQPLRGADAAYDQQSSETDNFGTDARLAAGNPVRGSDSSANPYRDTRIERTAAEERQPAEGAANGNPNDELQPPEGEPGRLPSDGGAQPTATTTPSDLAADRYGESDAELSGDPRANFAPPASAAGTSSAPAGLAAERGLPATEGTGRPGGTHLEGSQAPSLAIEKIAPREIQVGKPATFTIKVRNVGQVIAHGVEVHDSVPKGTQLADTVPRAQSGAQGDLVWDLGSIKPGQEAQVQMQLMPLTEGEIGSVATVHFKAEASARAKSTKPQLDVQVTAPQQVMIGEDVALKIKVSNPGSGAATGVILVENVPPGLKHPAANELEYPIGTLQPGESRELSLTMTAAQAGRVKNVLLARGEGNLQTEGHAEIEVVAPALKVGVDGAKRRFLERNATYTLSVSNPGTAPAREIELVAVIPKEMQFVGANNNGQYDAATRCVYWSLEELPAQETGNVSLTVLPVQAGECELRVQGKARQGLNDKLDESISVEGIAAILFQLSDVSDPIEVNGETSYEIKVVNQGTKAATNVRLVALVPPEMQAISADGPSRHVIDGDRVLFDPLAQLAPKADTTYSIKVRGLQAGDLRLRVQLLTDEMRDPVTKEESTHVFSNE